MERSSSREERREIVVCRETTTKTTKTTIATIYRRIVFYNLKRTKRSKIDNNDSNERKKERKGRLSSRWYLAKVVKIQRQVKKYRKHVLDYPTRFKTTAVITSTGVLEEVR